MKRNPNSSWPQTTLAAIPVIAAILTIASLTPAWAGKPGGGGTPAGTIYWNGPGDAQWNMWTMNADGKSKQYLCPNVCGEPSRLLHGGMRWFLEARTIGTGTFPNGNPRRELFAVRQDGLEVQLTDQPNLEWLGGAAGPVPARWAPGDAQVSWIAQRWDGEAVVESGIYAAEFAFDEQSQIPGVVAQADAPLVSDEALGNRINSHDWSPDGTRIVLEAGAAMFIADLDTGALDLVPTTYPVFGPVWSPADTKIAYSDYSDGDGIVTLNVDGAGEKVITSTGGVPIWSPTGSHLLYRLSAPNRWRMDIVRIPVDGGSKLNLTKDLDGGGFARGWR
jgi:hypothetical protein